MLGTERRGPEEQHSGQTYQESLSYRTPDSWGGKLGQKQKAELRQLNPGEQSMYKMHCSLRTLQSPS